MNSGNNDANPVQLYKRLRDRVLERRPVLGKILAESGNSSLYNYSHLYYRSPDYHIDPTRKTEFILGFKEEVETLFGKEIAESCATQIEKSYHLANTEHHGPIGTSRQLNNILIATAPTIDNKTVDFPYNIIIACSNISFNNWSYPRGLAFHTYGNKGLSEIQLSFFGHTIDAYPVYNHKSYNKDSIKNMKKSLYTLWNERFVWKKEFKKLNLLIDEIFSDSKVLSEKIYTNQAARLNYLLWRKISQNIGKSTQQLIYVEQERLVNRLLLKFHLDSESIINKILFDTKYLDLVSNHFDGILCGFSEKTNYGTFHFWAIPKGSKYRTQLWRRGENLVSPDGKYEVALTPDGIRSGILAGELVPSTLLSFIIFSFYYGLRQIGGPNQTTYLTQMKKAYLNLLNEIGDREDLKLVRNVPTTDIIPGNPPILAFLKGPNGEIIPATPLDLYLYGDENAFDIIKKVSEKVSLEDAISRTLPAWYKRCYSESEREADLANLEQNVVDSQIGLETKIAPFAVIGDKVRLQ